MPNERELLRAHRQSVRKRLGILANMIRQRRNMPRWRRLAAKLVTRRNGLGQLVVPSKNSMAELGAIYNFVDEALRYTRDPAGYDVFTPAERALELGVGDCDEQTQLSGILATNLGYPVIVRAVSFRNGKFSHVYPLMGVRKGALTTWVPLDVTHRRGLGESVNHQEKLEVRV